MSVQELKEKLIERIREEDDEHVLSMIYDWLRQESEVQEPGVIYLTEADRRGIEEGLEDIKAGRVYTDEQMTAMMDEHLKELEGKYGKGQMDK